MEKKTLGKGLEDISNVFLSKGVEEEKEEMHGNEIVEGENAVLAEGNCEVRELVTVHRKIASLSANSRRSSGLFAARE